MGDIRATPLLAIGAVLFALCAACAKHELEGNAGSAGAAGPDGGQADSGGPSSSDCEDEPWYKCEETCREVIILRGGGRSIGKCSGACRFDLYVRPAYDLEHADCFAVQVNLVIRNSDGSERTIGARLTDDAWEQLARISQRLADAQLEASSDCPNCSNAGEAWITLKGDDATEDEEFHYALRAPAPAMAEADEFVQALIDQLLACRGDLVKSCQLDAGCRFTYSAEAGMARCAITDGPEPPCGQALRCLCFAGVLPGSDDPTVCVDSFLTPRGAPTFTDVCASSETDATSSIAEALRTFGKFYQAEVTASPACDDIRAFY